jgi:hypothetical protein
MKDWPIQRIGEIDLDKLMNEIGHIKKPEIGPRQFPFQKKKSSQSAEESKGTNFILRTDEFDYDTLEYEDYPYMNSIITEYNMFRTRKMWMHEKFTYAWHVDNSPRIHIPLYTNEHCMWIIRDIDEPYTDRIYRIPADGGVYLVDTTTPHTFLNSNADEFLRTHIVGATTIKTDTIPSR